MKRFFWMKNEYELHSHAKPSEIYALRLFVAAKNSQRTKVGSSIRARTAFCRLKIKPCMFLLWKRADLWMKGCRPAVVVIRPFTCVGPDRSEWRSVCCCEAAPPNPRLHYSTGPNSPQTRGLPLPSKDVEYCIASCTTEVILLLQPTAAKPNLCIYIVSSVWTQLCEDIKYRLLV